MLEYPSIERQILELELANWKRWREHSTIWQSPDMALWRGPHGAWKAMKRDAPSAQPADEEGAK